MKKLITTIAIAFIALTSIVNSQVTSDELVIRVQKGSLYFNDSIKSQKLIIIEKFTRKVKGPVEDRFFGGMPKKLEETNMRYYVVVDNKTTKKYHLFAINEVHYDALELDQPASIFFMPDLSHVFKMKSYAVAADLGTFTLEEIEEIKKDTL